MNREWQSISRFFNGNGNEVAVVVSATLFLTLAKYHFVWNEWFNSFLYFGVLPVAVLLLLRKDPLKFGLSLGKPRIWGTYVLITCLIIAPFLLLTFRLDSFQKYYQIENFNFTKYFFQTFVYLLGWEYIFRGFLLFGLKDKMKEGSILVQMIPFVLLHLGKPELEILSTIITGIFFGFIAYRGNSFWPAFLIHMFINISFVALVNLA